MADVRLGLIACALLLIGCGGPPTIGSVTMSDADRKELLTAFDELDEVLQQRVPSVFESLAVPATAAELAALQAGLDRASRPYLAIWFQWHNGGKAGPVSLLPLGDLLSINEALADRAMNQSVPFVPHSRKRDLKLLDDGAGDGYFIDLSTQPPRVYYEMLEDAGKTDYGTLAEFLRFVAKVHQSGVSTVDETGAVDFDLDAYAQLESDHLASVRGR